MMAKPCPERQPERHNLLEDLLVHGLCQSRSVDPEEGLHFYISAPPAGSGVCLLFKLDWGGKRPLFPVSEKKADYLSLFVPRGTGEWLATLIELKAAQESHQREAIDQITNSMRLLRAELEALEVRHRLRWQAIILHGQGGQFPRRKAEAAGLPICSITSHHKADLMTFVTKRLETGVDAAPKPGGLNSAAPKHLETLERVLMLGQRSSPPPPSSPGLRLHATWQEAELTLGVEGGRVTVDGTPEVLVARGALCGAQAAQRP
jgi:hypothetical protein